MTTIDFQVLGEFQVLVGQDPVPLGSPRRRALLAVLLACANETLAAPSLISELWPEGPPRNALANLRTYASDLRRTLPSDLAARMSTRNGGYRLQVRPGEFDLWRMRQAFRTAREALDRADPAAAVTGLEPLERALTTGGAFAGVVAGPILEAARSGIADECRKVLEAYFEACIMAGTHTDVVAALRSHVRRHPLGEHGYALLMAALARAGDNAAALEVYRQARRLLVAELGIEPSAELQGMQKSILRGEARPAPASGVPPSAGSQGPTLFRPFQLPPDLPDFSGRREAVKNAAELLRGGSSGAWPAVASITGMPGTGKSTLAVHVAHKLRGEFPDGQIYVDLAGDNLGAVDPHSAIGQVLAGLGFAPAAIPATLTERTAVLRSFCAGRRLLLVLDNVRTAEHALPLFPASPSCGLLITSRAHLAGLKSWPSVELAPFDHDDGVELLARIVGPARVQAEPGAAARVVELCAGLPLAIRIAGTRLASRDHQPLSWLAARLDDEQTRLDELAITGAALRSSFDLVYRGLDVEHQRALRILGMLDIPDFGAWIAAAALQNSVREAEDIIDGLVQARLLTVTAGRALAVPRYRFHQLVRLYIRDLVAAAESPQVIADAVSRAYRACLAAAAQTDQRLRSHVPLLTSDRSTAQASQLLDGIEPAAWFANEQATLVAVVHGAATRGWHDLTWDLALTLQRFLESHHHFGDWHDVVTAGLSAAQASGNTLAEAAMLYSLGEAQAVQDDYASAAETFRAALDLASGPGASEQRARARVLLGLSDVHRARGQLDEGAAAARSTIEIVDGQLDPGVAAEAWMALGSIEYRQGDLAASRVSFQHALEGFVATGDRMNQAILLVNMGTTDGTAGRPEEAERCFRQSALICQQIGFRNGEAFAYTSLGGMLRRHGDYVRAEQSLLAALALVRDYADTLTESKIVTHLGELYRASDLDRSREHFTRAVDLLSSGQMPVNLADALAGLAETEVSAGDHAAARTAWTRAISVLAPVDAKHADELRRRLATLAEH
ncbi:MAG TPA: BTAD domain-containing putative transcriptional regulator [Streptosporangiaceae bacterium]|nr:BTAD domain-containing putative transcriptional regulator [Streptosporangiaceae bacterium]